MKDLIKALQIFLKYGNPEHPIDCEPGVLIVEIEPTKVTREDKKELQTLGFNVEKKEDYFYSYKYGSC